MPPVTLLTAVCLVLAELAVGLPVAAPLQGDAPLTVPAVELARVRGACRVGGGQWPFHWQVVVSSDQYLSSNTVPLESFNSFYRLSVTYHTVTVRRSVQMALRF